MRIAGFIENSIVDGEGIRSVLFLQGCPHHCKGCHNPQTWDMEGGEEITKEEAVAMCNSTRFSVTISGGEPFSQMEDLLFLCEKLHEHKNVWVYTGYTYEVLAKNPLAKKILSNIDCLVDGAFVEEKKDPTLLYRGSSNQRILKLKDGVVVG